MTLTNNGYPIGRVCSVYASYRLTFLNGLRKQWNLFNFKMKFILRNFIGGDEFHLQKFFSSLNRLYFLWIGIDESKIVKILDSKKTIFLYILLCSGFWISIINGLHVLKMKSNKVYTQMKMLIESKDYSIKCLPCDFCLFWRSVHFAGKCCLIAQLRFLLFLSLSLCMISTPLFRNLTL